MIMFTSHNHYQLKRTMRAKTLQILLKKKLIWYLFPVFLNILLTTPWH
jgi:hypothetical protein